MRTSWAWIGLTAFTMASCGGDAVVLSGTPEGRRDGGDGEAGRAASADAGQDDARTGGGGKQSTGGAGGGEATGSRGGVDASLARDATADVADAAGSDGETGSDSGVASDAGTRQDATGETRRDARAVVDSSWMTDGSTPAEAAADARRPDAGGAFDAAGCGGDGGSVLCSRNDDCCGAEVCGAFRGSPTASFCSEPFPSGGSLGEPCTGAFSLNPTCSNGLCPTTTRTCSAVCASDEDCRSQAADHLCAEFRVNGTPTGLCVRDCSGDPACGAGQLCVLRSNEAEDRLDTYCRVAPSSGDAPGAACSSGSTCDHGLCAFLGPDRFCTAPCETPADCPPAVPECVDFTFTTPESGAEVQVGLCAPGS